MSNLKAAGVNFEPGDYEQFSQMIGGLSASAVIAELIRQIVRGKDRPSFKRTVQRLVKKPRRRMGRPVGKKDSIPRKARTSKDRIPPASGTSPGPTDAT